MEVINFFGLLANLHDLTFSATYPLSRLQSIRNGKRMAERLAEERRLDQLAIVG